MSIDLTGIDKTDKNAYAEYSYPIAKITSGSSSGPWFLNFYGLAQNFSASFTIGGKNTYISGVCTKASITKKSHKTNTTADAELVLEHKKSDNTSFYIVVPLVFDSNAKDNSQLETLYNPTDDQVIDLNIDFKKIGSKIFCYKNTDSRYIFVFEDAITLKNKPSNLSELPAKYFKSQITKEKDKNDKSIPWQIKIANGQNTQDEVVCEYAATVDELPSPIDKTQVMQIIFWFIGFIGFVFSTMYVFDIYVKNQILFKRTFGIGLVLFIIFIALFSVKSYNINYGAASIYALVLMVLSLQYHGKAQSP